MKYLALALIPPLLSACGSDSDSDSNSNNEESIQVPGFYTGFLDINGNSNGFPFSALVSSSNQLVLIGNPGGSGEIIHQNGTYQLSLTLFSGSNFLYQSQSDDLQLNTVSATVDQEGIGASWDNTTATIPASSTTEERVLLNLTKSSTANTTDMEALAGTWSASFASSGGGLLTQTITVDSAGQIDGSDTNGCLYLGSITQSEATTAIPFSITLSSCNGANGTYEGLMTRITVSGNHQLHFFASNSDNAFAGVLQ